MNRASRSTSSSSSVSTGSSIGSTLGIHIVKLNDRNDRNDRNGRNDRFWKILWLFLSGMRTCFRWDDYRCMGRLAT